MSLPPSALLLAMGKVGHEAKEAIPQLPYIGGCLVMISDKGEGTVGASSDGRADITYQFAPDDMKNMRRGIQRTAEVLWAAGAKKLMVPIGGTGGRWMSSLDEMVAAVKDIELQDFRALYSAHPMATCRMGKAMETSVVQPSGETHGMPGLYVADSSVFPTPLGVNPQLTTMAIATTMGRGILARV
jgi:choline dehydrogenase-like flavoprotein